MTLKLVAAAPLAVVTVAAVEPTRWHLLGFEYEAAPLLGGLVACLCVRAWVSLSSKAHRWTVEAPVFVLAALFTASAIIGLRPNPITAILIGTGFGATGAKIIERGKRFIDRVLPDDPPNPGA